MPRANRYFIPGNIWHITHRCHKRDFLLRFRRDRKRWMHWLFEAKRRFGVRVLNFIVTSNHIHLLVSDDTAGGDIPAFMQLVQGRTAQDYNNRKNRNGAFWEDRYHATAIASDEHIIQCMVYISMNMVRAGVVNHPEEWEESGYYEIQHPRKRYAIIDYALLMKLLNTESMDQMQQVQQAWIKDALEKGNRQRNGKWTEAVAVGNEAFLESIRKQLDIKAKSRRIKKNKEGYELSEPAIPYTSIF